MSTLGTVNQVLKRPYWCMCCCCCIWLATVAVGATECWDLSHHMETTWSSSFAPCPSSLSCLLSPVSYEFAFGLRRRWLPQTEYIRPLISSLFYHCSNILFAAKKSTKLEKRELFCRSACFYDCLIVCLFAQYVEQLTLKHLCCNSAVARSNPVFFYFYLHTYLISHVLIYCVCVLYSCISDVTKWAS